MTQFSGYYMMFFFLLRTFQQPPPTHGLERHNYPSIANIFHIINHHKAGCDNIARTHTHSMMIEKLHNSQRGNCQGPGAMRSQAEWFLEPHHPPRKLPSWVLYNFRMGIGSCFYPMTHSNEGHWVLGNHAIPNTPFLHWFWHWSKDKNSEPVTINCCRDEFWYDHHYIDNAALEFDLPCL